MANSIALAKKYVTLMDEVLALASLSAVLDSDASLSKEGANVGEIQIPKLALQGLADYSRASGYVAGDATLTWETVAYNYERGRKFIVDKQDDEQSLNMAFGKLAGEFLRTKVVPEMDAFRFATYATAAGTKVTADLTSATILPAIDAAIGVMVNAEVSKDGLIIFMTPSIYNALKQSGAATRFVPAGAAIDRNFESFDSMKVVIVPESRFYTAIDLTAGGAGGYAMTAGAKKLNFLIVHPGAVLQFSKNAVPKIIDPDTNQDADAWIFGYRINSLADVLDNKTKGIYCHNAA